MDKKEKRLETSRSSRKWGNLEGVEDRDLKYFKDDNEILLLCLIKSFQSEGSKCIL